MVAWDTDSNGRWNDRIAVDESDVAIGLDESDIGGDESIGSIRKQQQFKNC